MVRHFREVAASLERRNNIPLAVGEILWLVNNVELLKQTQLSKKHFVYYASLIEHRKLPDSICDLPMLKNNRAINDHLVKQDYRHHIYEHTENVSKFTPLCAELLQYLYAPEKGSAEFIEQFEDRLVRSLDEIQPIGELQHRFSLLNDRLSVLEPKANSLETQSQELRAAYDTEAAHRAKLETQSQELRAAYDAEVAHRTKLETTWPLKHILRFKRLIL